MKKTTLSLIIALSSLNTIRSQNFDWAKSFGSTGNDMGTAITVDPSGNVITVGNFSNTIDFDPSVSAIQNLSSVVNGGGMFVSKLSSGGNYIWAKSFDGGSEYNLIKGVATDTQGNIYTIGEFGAVTDFDPSPITTYTLAPSGPTDMFVAKLDATGNFVWAFRVGGSNNTEFCHSIYVDVAGNVYMTGGFSQTVDFDPSSNSGNLTSIGGGDAFVAKYNSAGNHVWSGRMGGGGGASGLAVTVDAALNMYVTGWFNGVADMDPAPATLSTYTSVGLNDVFVTKLDASGNFLWAKQMGGTDRESPYDIALDANSNIYVSGSFEGTTDFDPSLLTHTITANAGSDMFISKLDASGTFVWAHSFGSNTTDNDAALAIVVSSQGNIFVTGGFYATVDFDPSISTSSVLSSAGGIDMFVTKLNASGNLIWAKQMSSPSYDLGQGIAVDAAENVYTTGAFYSVADYDPSSASYPLSSSGLYDVFVSKLKVDEIATVGFNNNFSDLTLVTLYPNPTDNALILNTRSFENTDAVLYNVNGQKVLSVKLQGSSTTLDLDKLSEGIYAIELLQNNIRIYQSKIIKTNK